MRGLLRLALIPTLVGIAVLTLAFLGYARGPDISAEAQEGAVSLGIDVNPDGNSATTVGSREVCLEVKSGDRFTVDITTQGVSSLIAWEAYLAFEPNVVQVVDRDVQQLVASIPDSNVIDTSESVPDDDGKYRAGGSDISDPPVGVDGDGVLARLTLEAQNSGLTSLSVAPIQTDVGPVGAFLRQADGELISDADEDGLFDGPVLDAQVAVDQACPGEGGVQLTDVGGDDGIALWVFLIIAVVAAAAAGFGGVALIVLRRSGSRPA